MKKYKILYGVCGIGNGHAQRQLPLIEYFSSKAQIVIFAYDTSFDFYSKYFEGKPEITVLNVAVPFYVGNKEGIDFEATEKLESNKKDYTSINEKAVTQAEEIIGLVDLVITDYEPISAQYAYKHKIPLITIDQQSKYLAGDFPTELGGETYADEVARLKLFFPEATVRIACSFFNLEKKINSEDVIIVPPVLKESVLNMQHTLSSTTTILVYLSSQREFPQSLEQISLICSLSPEVDFHIFAANLNEEPAYQNVTFYKHGDSKFYDVLKKCSGIVSTAGHTLLSEAMYLGIPVYAIPLPVYEQQMNAEIIDRNKFGIKSGTFSREKLKYFISNISEFKNFIQIDTGVLLRGDGREHIIKLIEEKWLNF